MAVATLLGVMAQHWMSYTLLEVEGGFTTWCYTAALLATMGLLTALLIGLPSRWLTGVLGLSGASRALATCVLAALLTSIAHRSIAPWASTAFDEAVIPALCLAFFGVFEALYPRRQGDPPGATRASAGPSLPRTRSADRSISRRRHHEGAKACSSKPR